MKYIRIKGQIIDLSKINVSPNVWGNIDNYIDFVKKTEKILKQADTIEELCDGFVAYNSEQNNGLPITCPKEMLGKIKPYIQIGMQKGINCWLCGAIWTEWGLKYVAKMNEKGELELL